MEKYLFYDIDGTLVGASRRITEKTKQAIMQAKDNGHKVFLCTGRPPTAIGEELTSLNFDGIVCSAGGFVIADNEFIFENFINQYILAEVIALFINNSILFTLETKGALYQTPGVNEFFDQMHQSHFPGNLELERFFEIRRENENRKPIKDFNILTTGVAKVCFIATEKERFYQCAPFLEEFFNVVIFSKETDDYINGEIILKHCTKADGVKCIIDHYNADMKATIGFGDSMNDYQMIKDVHVGVVYKDAKQELKDLASHFFDDPDQDGIYHAMTELGLINMKEVK